MFRKEYETINIGLLQRGYQLRFNRCFPGLNKLDLGSGIWGPPPGHIGIDNGSAFDYQCQGEPEKIIAWMRRDDTLLWDLHRYIPFDTASIEAIRMCQYWEHHQSPEMLLQECARVLIDGGEVISISPAPLSPGLYNSYSHINFRPITWYAERPWFDAVFEVVTRTFEPTALWESIRAICPLEFDIARQVFIGMAKNETIVLRRRMRE